MLVRWSIKLIEPIRNGPALSVLFDIKCPDRNRGNAGRRGPGFIGAERMAENAPKLQWCAVINISDRIQAVRFARYDHRIGTSCMLARTLVSYRRERHIRHNTDTNRHQP